MAFKERVERDELKILRLLNARMKLSVEDKKNYYRLEKGFEGEKMFDQITDRLPEDKFLTLNDLQLKANNQNFQVDSSVIVQETLNVFEVKNYKGDYEFDPKTGRFYTPSEKEFVNPLYQVKRCETLMRCLLQDLQFRFEVKAWLIFINPEFHLYHAPKNPQIIFPAQIHRFMEMFQVEAIPAFLSDYHFQLAEKLVSLHKIEAPRLPSFKFDDLKKSLLCGICHNGFMVHEDSRELICPRCGAHESVESAVMRNVREIRLLFPEVKVTTNLVFEWCGGVVGSKATVWRILKKNMKLVGFGQWAYFE